METLTVRILNGDFGYGLKTVKGWGFRYDAFTRTWQGRLPAALQSPVVDVPGYLRTHSLAAVDPFLSQHRTDKAQTWQGQASMDAKDSHF